MHHNAPPLWVDLKSGNGHGSILPMVEIRSESPK